MHPEIAAFEMDADERADHEAWIQARRELVGESFD
jgi:hypothetical protein